jgi:hypothetical protein
MGDNSGDCRWRKEVLLWPVRRAQTMVDKGCYFFIGEPRETAMDCYSFRHCTGFWKSEHYFQLWLASQNYLQRVSAQAAAVEECL